MPSPPAAVTIAAVSSMVPDSPDSFAFLVRPVTYTVHP
jgi:hypothetical protein